MNTLKDILRTKKWHLEHAEHLKKYHAEYYLRNKAKFQAAGKAWREANRGAKRASHAKRKAAKRQATPSWADMAEIREIYIEAVNRGLQVDHVYPLQSDWVCGLHTHNNLQLLPATANNKKSNSYMKKFHGAETTIMHAKYRHVVGLLKPQFG